MPSRSASARKPLVSVITPTIAGREHLLVEAEASVRWQTENRIEHLVGLDSKRIGCARTVNQIARQARASWLFILADDDLLLPACLELLLSVAEGAHVVYSPPLVWGEAPGTFWGSPPNIPSAALISTDLWREAGGYNQRLSEMEDNDLWRRLLRGGAVFCRYAERPTWVYRFHEGRTGNKSRGRLR